MLLVAMLPLETCITTAIKFGGPAPRKPQALTNSPFTEVPRLEFAVYPAVLMSLDCIRLPEPIELSDAVASSGDSGT